MALSRRDILKSGSALALGTALGTQGALAYWFQLPLKSEQRVGSFVFLVGRERPNGEQATR